MVVVILAKVVMIMTLLVRGQGVPEQLNTSPLHITIVVVLICYERSRHLRSREKIVRSLQIRLEFSFEGA